MTVLLHRNLTRDWEARTPNDVLFRLPANLTDAQACREVFDYLPGCRLFLAEDPLDESVFEVLRFPVVAGLMVAGGASIN